MNHQGTKTLETERLILRKFDLNDSEAMYRNWASDPEVTKYLTWETYQSVSEADSILAMWAKDYEKPDFYQWAVVLKEISEPIGSISVVNMEDDIPEIGYCIGKAWWNMGITTEALKRVMKYLFEEVEVNKIIARHDVRNPASGMVMKKAGMKYTGIENNQGIGDYAEYALTEQRMAKRLRK